jgi:hypothetical protein
MTFQVRSSEDSAAVLSYFNDFHDSFLESIVVRVFPESAEGFGFGLPVRHDVTLRFVHSNYPAAEESGDHQRRIEMRLALVRGLHVGDLIPVDNMLQECLIEVGANGIIRLDVGGDGLVTFFCDALTIEETAIRDCESAS